MPVHSVYRSDDVMMEWLKDDLVNRTETRLFVADLSEVDFLGHAYGSESRQYLEAIGRAGERIAQFLAWLDEKDSLKTAVIVSSDHGMVAIDHSYLLFDAEKYVPLFFFGHGVKKGKSADLRRRRSWISRRPSATCSGRGTRRVARSRVIIEAIEP